MDGRRRAAELIIVGLIAMPYIDFNPKGNGYYTFAERPFAITTFLFGFLILWVVLIVLGTFLRGPNWNFFGPFEFWDSAQGRSAEQRQPVGVFLAPPARRRAAGESLHPRAAGHHPVPGLPAVLPALLAKSAFKSFYLKMGSPASSCS